jgi:hypothetical protein
MGVPTVPFAHIYHPEGGLVEEMMWQEALPLYQCILYVEYADA